MFDDFVIVYPLSNTIFVNNKPLEFEFSIPENLPQDLTMVHWKDPNVESFYRLKSSGSNQPIEETEENYNFWVKPFYELWQAEYNRVHADDIYFPRRQRTALDNLNADFETAKERAHIKSSLGFEADANQTANENVNGLLITIGEGETVAFCDYYNEFHELTRADLETLQTEIIQNAQSLYAQKWQYRTAIEACIDNEGLDEVVATIEFTYMDFTPQSEAAEGATETDGTETKEAGTTERGFSIGASS